MPILWLCLPMIIAGGMFELALSASRQPSPRPDIETQFEAPANLP